MNNGSVQKRGHIEYSEKELLLGLKIMDRL